VVLVAAVGRRIDGERPATRRPGEWADENPDGSIERPFPGPFTRREGQPAGEPLQPPWRWAFLGFFTR
jgi:hypothetical protein